MKKITGIVFVLFAMMLSACDQLGASDNPSGVIVNMLPATRSIKLTDGQREFVEKSNEFSFDFYKSVSKYKQNQNVVVSPLSVAYILGMLNSGADGKTSDEIVRTLGLSGNDKNQINEFFKALIEQAPIADPSVMLQIANVIAADKGVELEESFSKDMNDYYSAETATLDFRSPTSVVFLNDWCKEKTQGMIPVIVDKISEGTKLVLMNAIFFNATWTKKFDESDTKVKAFSKSDGTTVNIAMMHRKADLLYKQNNVYTNVRLPFGSGDKWSMYILLPNEGKTIDDIISGLDSGSWKVNKATFGDADYIIDLEIPRFKYDFDISLKDIVSEMGAPLMFSSDADFSHISKNVNDISVGMIKQKAAIEVTEEGTKTSAVTITGMETDNLPRDIVYADFHCDRPFVYVIQEASSGAIFFIGTFRGE